MPRTARTPVCLPAYTWEGEALRFLGFVIGLNLHFGDPERVRAMALVPRPKTKKGVRRFIGGTGFYSELVPGYAECVAALHRCTPDMLSRALYE